MKKFFKKLFSGITLVLLVGNFITPISVFAATDEVQTDQIVTSTTEVVAGEVTGETISEVTLEPPVVALTDVTMKSDNLRNTAWAKDGDAVFIEFSATADDPSVAVTVNRNSVSATDIDKTNAPEKYIAKYYVDSKRISNPDTDGLISFVITFGEANYTTVMSGSVVTIDNTAPVVSIPTPSMTLTAARAINTPIKDLGVLITENTGIVDVSTEWSVPVRNINGTYSYKVTYSATDTAGNIVLVSQIVDVLLDGSFVDTRSNNPAITINLLGEKVLPTHAELNQIYKDAGANIVWDSATSDTILTWATGDLNTSITKTGYKLTYNAEYDTAPLPLSQKGLNKRSITPVSIATRTIDVSDTTIPGAVTNFRVVAGNGYINLFWANPTDIDFAGVQIWKSIDSGIKGDLLLTTSPGTVSYEDTNVTNGLTYYYTLVAFDINGNSSVNSPQLAATPLSPQIASADVTFVPDASSNQETTEVKGGTTPQNETKEDKNEPVKILGLQWYWWVMILVIIAGGIYYRYQYPSKPTPPVKKKRKK